MSGEMEEGAEGCAVAYLGLGSNQGDSRALLVEAVRGLSAAPRVSVTRSSRYYRTAAIGLEDQPDFLNMVVEIVTDLDPLELLEVAQALERHAGRVRTVRWGPRTLDVDILWYDGISMDHDHLRLPHPRMEERRFVLEPLAELVPDLVLGSGRTVRAALAGVLEQDVVAVADPTKERGGVVDYSAMQEELRTLAREKHAVILAHNYQRPEVQDAADYVGDSLGLSRQAAASEADTIVFCGVDFMAETAAILAPTKRVIFPEERAHCPMAAMVDEEGLAALKAEHPGAVVVSYVNTSAAVKALSDICCTSANAPEVVASVPADREIIFTPDCNLGAWVAEKTGREMILWKGYCPTHDLIQPEDILEAKALHPEAKVVVHPECRPDVTVLADAVESTSGMIRFCREDDAQDFIVGTESGMIHRLSVDIPGKRFFLVNDSVVCPTMKMTTLRKAIEALRREGPVVTVPEDIRLKALAAVQRMVEIGR